MTTTALAPTPSLTTRAPRRWLALTVLAFAQFLVVLDASIVNIALPSIGSQLGLDTVALSWVITAYVLPFGGLLLLGGRLADRYGHRRLFMTGTAGFVAASAAAGLASSGAMLLAARAFQGGSAALLAPASLALVTQIFVTSSDRAKALGIWGAVAGAGSAAGVLLGGILTSALGWESVFFVNVPIGMLVLATIPGLITRDTAGERTRLDLPGALTVTAGLTAIVGALSQTERLGFTHPVVIGLGVVGAVLLAVFVAIEARTASPLVRLHIFRNRSVSGGNLAMLFVGGATTGVFFALSIYMQAVLGYDALKSGLTQLPLAGTLVLTAGAVPAAIERLGLRRTVAVSLTILAGGLAWLATAPYDATFLQHILGPSVVIGIGLAGAFVAGTQLAVDGVATDEAGLASGLVNTSQQIGGALGLAVLTTLATNHTTHLLATSTPATQALTAGLSWAFLGAGAFALVGAIAVTLVGQRHKP
ncbi:DHA2 family efflux MFS transporter permease subunit [Nocardioides sp. URHA0020]|uniref:DHA2 family efflux MFS transporter permease subunit n=1 Tax=Nocardioides sp. URHA0020 TaxID=1380392 RepID=UPI000492057F|nr:DHA2 family efflux MFS transporter permease subunit [Nocardioides sp. URHA0020]